MITQLDESLKPLLVFSTIALAFVVHRYVMHTRASKTFAAQHGCKPMRSIFPYKWPFALDLLYNQYQVNKTQRLLASQTPFFNELGPNIKLSLLGETGFLTFHPENLEAILSTKFDDYVLGSRRDALQSFLGKGIFTQDGQPWYHSRFILRRLFTKMQYQDLTKFDGHVNNLVSNLQRSSGVVDLQPYFFNFTLATTTALIFGQPMENCENEPQDKFASNFDNASLISAIRLRLNRLYWLYTPLKYTKSCNVVKEYAIDFVEQAMKNKDSQDQKTKERYAFIQGLLNEIGDPILVRDQLINVLMAGRDSTAALLSWTFFLLLRHSHALERLRKEVSTVMADEKTPNRELIQKLSWLKCVLNETLRLYPQPPVNVRFAKRNTVIPRGGGRDGQSAVMIPKNTGIGWSTYHMHRLPALYGDDAEDYEPERWESAELNNIGWGFLPFNGGPRSCLGKDFALMEVSCAVVGILQNFPNIRLPDNLPIEPTGQEKQSLGILVTSAEGCKVLLD